MDYAKNWWIHGQCQYLKMKERSGKHLSLSYADIQRLYLEKHILPHFSNKTLSKITSSDIERWISKLTDQGNLSSVTISNCYGVLRIMFNEAERIDIIHRNPIKKAVGILAKEKEKGILSIEEYKKLFDEENISSLWNENLIHYTISLLSASGGLRCGEIQALQNQHVHENYIFVCYSFDRKYGLKTTKNKETRFVTMPEKTNKFVHLLKRDQPEGFVFSIDGGISPIKHRSIAKYFCRVLERAGISEDERKERNISFHSHRHFFTTVMRKKVPDIKLQMITGHKSIEMLTHYDHPTFDISEYTDVINAQRELF